MNDRVNEPRRIYLDHAATTPVRPEIRDLLSDIWSRDLGHAGSPHAEGRRAREMLESAREAVRASLGADDFDVVFTATGSEANALALVGRALAAPRTCPVLATAVEHPSVLETERTLARLGSPLELLPVDADGRAIVDAAATAIGGVAPLVVSVAAVSSEVGTIQPVAEISAPARRRGSLVHCDAVQAIGSGVPVDLDAVDLLTFSGHKLGAPAGIAALLVRRGVELAPLIAGGGQEQGRRSGTPAAALAAALALALELSRRTADPSALTTVRDAVRRELERALDGIRWNTPEDGAAPHILSFSLEGVHGASLMLRLDAAGLAVATGSACRHASGTPSRTLLAMGRTPEAARGTLRLSFGREHDPSDAPEIARRVAREVEALRRLSGHAPVRGARTRNPPGELGRAPEESADGPSTR